MGLEIATYIHELDASNPVGATDQKSQGDDHIRMIKGALQNTLPNIEGPVTASHAELNLLVGETLFPISGIYTPTISNIANTSGALTPTGFTYLRIGNIVVVFGDITVANLVAGAGTNTAVDVTLPIPSDFTSFIQARGAGFGSAGANRVPCEISSNPTSNRLNISFAAPGVGGGTIQFVAAYQVI